MATPQQESDREAGGRLEKVASDLGAFFGSVTGRVESWVGERDKLVKELKQIQTTAESLLDRLTNAAAAARRATRRGRPRKRSVTATASSAESQAGTTNGRRRKRRRFSAATIAKMRAAQRARWARVRKAAK